MKEIISNIAQYPVIPIYYHDDIEICKRSLAQCYHGGVRVFEFVNRGPKALENFQELKMFRDEYFQDLKLGIGTIKNRREASAFIALQPDFLVSPIVKKEIADVTLADGILWIPGAMTATEIDMAEEFGAPLVKLFPGDVLGTSFLAAVKPLFPNVKFLITGGVNIEEANIKAWFSSGATALGLGSKLFTNLSGDEEIQQRVKKVLSWA